jgi:mono/diheme cytochrome c family protein
MKIQTVFGRDLRPWWAVAGGLLLAVLVLGALQWQSTRRTEAVARALTHGDPAKAPALIRRFGCGGCHTISGIGGADGLVAPSLDHLRQRVFIGGVVRHTPDALVGWIVSPQAFSPHSAMPATGVDVEEARDIAAYLYTR